MIVELFLSQHSNTCDTFIIKFRMYTNALFCRMQVPVSLLHFKDKHFNVYNQNTVQAEISA